MLSLISLVFAFRKFYPINYIADLKIVTFYWHTLYIAGESSVNA